MITIEHLQPGQVQQAKKVISSVAQRIFEPEMTSEQFASVLEDEHELQDVDDFQTVYGGRKGTFLVVLENGVPVGTGAIKPFNEHTAELKRIWLLERFHGMGIGVALVASLLEFARHAGYKKVCLQTDSIQKRAIAFYKKLGFVEVPPFRFGEDADDVSMEIDLYPV